MPNGMFGVPSAISWLARTSMRFSMRSTPLMPLCRFRNTACMVDALGVDTIVMRSMESEDVASLPDGDRERLVHDIRAQRPIPALTAGEKAALIRFARGTDERVK